MSEDSSLKTGLYRVDRVKEVLEWMVEVSTTQGEEMSLLCPSHRVAACASELELLELEAGVLIACQSLVLL